MIKKIKIIHPGEILQTEFLNELSITQYRLAKDIDVTPIRINEIIKGKRAVSADTALRLAKYFGNSAEFWLNLQMQYDLAKENIELHDVLKNNVKIFANTARA